MGADARIRDLVLVGHGRTDESESVATNVHIGDRLFDPRHVAGYALIAGAPSLMMRVFFNGGCVRPVRGARSMAFETEDVCWFYEQCLVLCTVDIVAARAFHTALIHNALHEVVPLHAVFVSCAICEMGERSLA